MKRTLALLLLLLMTIPPVPAKAKYGGGSGTADDPYQIWTAEQMNAIGLDANDWDKNFRLMADIDLTCYTATDFNIIGRFSGPTNSKPFKGVLDGNAKRISNFNYSPPVDTPYIGIFGYVQDAEIKELELLDPNVGAGARTSCAGLLVGYLDNSTVTNCYIHHGNISVHGTAGGLVGCSYRGTILNCHVQCNVLVEAGQAGGLVGNNSGTITNCSSSGQVSGTGTSTGGLAGYNTSAITDCTSSVDVSGVESVGGLVGCTFGRITNCSSTGTVSGVKYVGGLVGGNNGLITCCYTTSQVSGRTYAGGLAGQNGLAGGDVVFSAYIYDCYATGSVLGEDCLGGLVGFNDYYGKISNTYAAGRVSGLTQLGGLIGKTNRGPVNRSFWDINATCQTISAAGTGKSTTQMQTSSTFAAWGCNGLWTIDDGADYPRLSWERLHGQPITKPAYGGGTGTETDPYLIYTTEQLNQIGLTSCDWDRQFKLMADIDLSELVGTTFNAIGYYSTHYNDDNIPFTGLLDGNGMAISNFCYTSESADNLGLIRYLAGNGCVRDLRLIDPNVEGGTGRHVGSLVGFMSGGELINCRVQGGHASGDQEVGGLVGRIEGTATGCHFEGTVSGRYIVGGLAGVGCTITDCSTNVQLTGGSTVGGVVGMNYGRYLANCRSEGTVSGDGGVGGLVGSNGYTDGFTIDCNSSANVSGQGSTGGLAGMNWGIIINCSANGNVSGGDYVGGLVSRNSGTITASHTTGHVVGGYAVGGLVAQNSKIISTCYSTADVSGRDCVGGLTGYNKSTITSCYSLGRVTGRKQIGGLVGENNWDGLIVNCYSNSNVDGNDSVGGLVGFNSASISNTYAAGTVAGTTYVGGLIGRSHRAITASFWDAEVAGLMSSAGGTARTSAQMRLSDTFIKVGWDFVGESANGTDDIWTICEAHDYPKLTWQFTVADFDNDGDVDFADYSILASRWGGSGDSFWCGQGGTDLTCDGYVDLADLMTMTGNWLADDRP
jgi:hypothetical protein